MGVFNQVKKAVANLKRKFIQRRRAIQQKDINFIFFEEKSAFLDAVVRHPVSQEISSHSHNSLYLPSGSLFGFLGFKEGSRPVDDLVEFLDERIRINIYPIGKEAWGFNLVFPTVDDMRESGKLSLPWESGEAWPVAVERGLNNYQHFLGISEKGRSMEGLQSKGVIREGNFGGVEYITPLLREFRQNMIYRVRSYENRV